MESELKHDETRIGTWDSEHVKALLHFPRFPIRLIQQEPWQSWIGQRGGLKTVITYLQTYPLSPSHRRFLDVVLASPEAVADVYADHLNISRSTYFYQQREFIAALVQALNHWEIEPVVTIPEGVSPSRSLPIPLTDLVGAEASLQTLMQMLLRDDVRLVTLLGPGGIGKTRLSIELAHQLQGEICFVDFSGLNDHTKVVATIAETLGLKDQTISALKTWLYPRKLFLILDNFEQLLPAKTIVTALLTTAPQLKIIVTSRTALHVYGEYEFVVPPLDVSHIKTVKDQQQWEQSPAIMLFVQRARTVNPKFVLSSENVEAVAQVCTHTEGLPLAIELAAFQAKYYSPQAMLKRLSGSRCLDFFSQVPHRMPFHQQTLRAVFDWSFDLLPPELQTLFCQLSVFPDGFSLEAAELICGVKNAQLELTALVDHSLLEQQTGVDGEPYFHMLGLTREYACERLSALNRTALV